MGKNVYNLKPYHASVQPIRKQHLFDHIYYNFKCMCWEKKLKTIWIFAVKEMTVALLGVGMSPARIYGDVD